VARVFISYAREDKPVVEPLAEGLRHAGHEVWWDVDLEAGDAFRGKIESQIAGADVVLVVWSQRANASRYVIDEADRAADLGVLLPLRLDTSPRSVSANSMLLISATGEAITSPTRGADC